MSLMGISITLIFIISPPKKNNDKGWINIAEFMYQNQSVRSKEVRGKY
jgi:hypothetical protein